MSEKVSKTIASRPGNLLKRGPVYGDGIVEHFHGFGVSLGVGILDWGGGGVGRKMLMVS